MAVSLVSIVSRANTELTEENCSNMVNLGFIIGNLGRKTRILALAEVKFDSIPLCTAISAVFGLKTFICFYYKTISHSRHRTNRWHIDPLVENGSLAPARNDF
jgi:hypothetical protein